MSRIFEEIVRKRGLSEDFLSPKYLEDEKIFLKLPDIERATEVILEAISEKAKIMVYGDYDVDGVTATTLMVEALKLAGAKEVITMLPDRFIDGYGMSQRSIERAVSEGVSLIVTVDCGSNNAAVITELREVGIKTVVTDHHEVMGELPEAEAVINPKRMDISEEERAMIVAAGLNDLAGVGVAFMVALALVEAGKIKRGQEKWMLDLVLIGTLCDSMKISKLNRMLTYYGLKVLEKTRRLGLKELMRVARVSKITAEAVGFQIGPRLNAGGRMESAEISLKLLMTESKTEAVKLAEALNELNAGRREEQNAAAKEIEEKYENELSKPVIVVAGNWHEGVVGIIAGRLVEKYHKPAFVLTKVENGGDEAENIELCKGSGRSFGEFNLAEAIKECRGSLIAGGGHAGACGVKVSLEKIGEFSEAVNDYYLKLKLTNQERFLKTEAEIERSDLVDFSEELLDELARLEPFGNGNIEPVFELSGVEMTEVRGVGKDGRHLRVVIRDELGRKMTLIAFSAPEEWLKIEPMTMVSVKVQLLKNEWNGRISVEGRILEINY